MAASLLLSGCAAAPPPPYALAFSAEGRVPRLLWAGEETVIPLTVGNRGLSAWDPSSVHVSYHWLWLVPRETLRRSRTVPFHDGIRTDLAIAVPPGRTIPVDGRLLAPGYPGLYWLQWDMVQEGVTWFAQVSPRQPRQLVLVLPSLAGGLAPFPLILALVGVWGLARGARTRAPGWIALAGGADLVWSVATLLTKPLILVHQALLEPTPAAYLLIVIVAFAPPLLAAVLLPRRLRAWALFATGTFATVLILGDALYFRFFGDVLSVPAMLAIRQTGQVSGSIRSLLTPAMIWMVIDLPFALWMTAMVARRPAPAGAAPRQSRAVAVAACAVTLVAGLGLTIHVLRESRIDQMFRDRAVMEQLGPFGYHAYDAWTYARATLLRAPASPEQVAGVERWFAARAPVRAGAGPNFGIAGGRNVVVIQVESLQNFVVDDLVNGQPVMPHLRQWVDAGLRLTNVTDQTSEGRTSDAEFVALTSLLPLDHGAAAFRYPGDHYVAFPRVLAEHGYATLSAVPFEAGFWNRRVMHPAYGFEQSLFEPDFQLTEQIGWGLNDRDFLQQMVPRLAELPRPFAAWLITLSLHHPFDDFPDRYKVMSLGALERTPLGNYLHTMRFFDTALEDFRASLARAGLLDETMLVVFGDHDAGFARDPALASAIGIGADEASWELNDRVPFFIRWPKLESRPPIGRLAIAAGQTDFAPTLLALLGIDPSRLPYLGRNLLGEADDGPVVRPYGDWLDRAHLFISRTAAAGGNQCFSIRGASVDPSQCRSANERALRARDMARVVVAEQLQQQLREALR